MKTGSIAIPLIKTYYQLTKPGIIYGNALTAAAGFLLASRGRIHVGLLAAMLVGLALIMAAGCVSNNYSDRHIDKLMARTRRRALVTGSVSPLSAALYALVLAVGGALVLGRYTTGLALAAAMFGLFSYVVLYGFAKRRSVHGTVVGSIAGAVPPVVGYTAVTPRLDVAAGALFLLLVLWQMPHFYAIAIYRLDDYAAAKIPVLPAVKGLPVTKLYILAYIVAFTLALPLLNLFGYTGYSYLIVTMVVALLWLRLAIRGIEGLSFRHAKPDDDKRWARQLFLRSLIVLVVLSVMLSLGSLLP